MPLFDNDAAEALSARAIRPAFFAYLDILGDPVRATTIGHDHIFGTLSDPDLSEQTFMGVDPRVVSIGDVTYKEGGSETLLISMSGLILPDNDLLNMMADRANWQGRVARLWLLIRNEAGEQQGAIVPFYTGYMTSLAIKSTGEGQTILLEVENYRAMLNAASNRTYDQTAFDPADQSYKASVSAANNAKTGPAAGIGATNYFDYSGGGSPDINAAYY